MLIEFRFMNGLDGADEMRGANDHFSLAVWCGGRKIIMDEVMLSISGSLH